MEPTDQLDASLPLELVKATAQLITTDYRL
jgi:hypothetical protein